MCRYIWQLESLKVKYVNMINDNIVVYLSRYQTCAIKNYRYLYDIILLGYFNIIYNFTLTI